MASGLRRPDSFHLQVFSPPKTFFIYLSRSPAFVLYKRTRLTSRTLPRIGNIDSHTKHLGAWLGETNGDSNQAIRIAFTMSSEFQQPDFSGPHHRFNRRNSTLDRYLLFNQALAKVISRPPLVELAWRRRSLSSLGGIALLLDVSYVIFVGSLLPTIVMCTRFARTHSPACFEILNIL